MHLPLSRAVVAHLDVLPEIGSTNVELAARASAGSLADFTVLVTTNQTAGKGRLDREWVAAPETMIAVSVLFSPRDVSIDRLAWLPLLAGLAMTRAVSSLVADHEVSLKWPNDVQIDGLKVSGLLAQLVPGEHRVIVGAGLNLTMTPAQLPTPKATSLTLNGVSEVGIVDAALSSYLAELSELYEALSAAAFDATAAGIHAAVSSACSTIGKRVRVELPGGVDLYGTAEGLDIVGRLVVRTDGDTVSVAAGDVTHLRYE